MAKVDPSSGEYGTAAYDAVIHPADAGTQAVIAGKVQAARDLHFFGDKTAAARVYSHVYDSVPSATAVHFMGLAAHRDVIERQVQRVNDHPFPGVALGHTPGVHAAPNTNQLIGIMPPMTHHAQENAKATFSRRRRKR